MRNYFGVVIVIMIISHQIAHEVFPMSEAKEISGERIVNTEQF